MVAKPVTTPSPSAFESKNSFFEKLKPDSSTKLSASINEEIVLRISVPAARTCSRLDCNNLILSIRPPYSTFKIFPRFIISDFQQKSNALVNYFIRFAIIIFNT